MGRRMKPENRVSFNSCEEARASGYRACKICKPDGVNARPETLLITHYDSPLGRYILVSSKKGIVCIEPEERATTHLTRWKREGVQFQEGNGYNQQAATELDAYFTGKLCRFNIPLDLRGTDFQRRVWEVLQDIPYGETRSYGDVACTLGLPNASRAVGRANGANPISIVIPCHRVIGANGKLVGYGGGLHRKQALLDLEARVWKQT